MINDIIYLCAGTVHQMDFTLPQFFVGCLGSNRSNIRGRFSHADNIYLRYSYS